MARCLCVKYLLLTEQEFPELVIPETNHLEGIMEISDGLKVNSSPHTSTFADGLGKWEEPGYLKLGWCFRLR